ncbi:MAG: vanadium-dependent haloperoxidase, partial [Acidobacteriaceae bacterium]
GYACLWTVLTATMAFAERDGATPCHHGFESEHPALATNAVVLWNAVADNSIGVIGGKLPQQGSVETAIVQIAEYDAVNAICGYPFTVYAVKPKVHVPASPEAAVAAAAHDVLVALYPAQAAELDQQYADYLGAIPGHHEGKLNGIAVGQQTAAGILALRANDGRDAGSGWTPPPPGPGVWQPTPPGFLPAATPWIRFVTPWTMTSPSQFRVPPPPALDSDVWLHDYDETKAYGGSISSARTAEQTDLAEFVGGPGVNPMLQWHSTWRGIATDQELSVLGAVRLFAMLSAASSDALIGCWDSKFQYAFWRPVTAIRAGGGNPDLIADPAWIGLVITPNHPEYPAAHGCFSGSVVEVLRAYFGSDELHFTMSSPVPGLLEPVRSYDRVSQVLTDILNARIYGGMHYRNSTAFGSELGKQVARQALENFFLPRKR